MPRVEVIQVNGKEIISVDYSGCKPAEMITVFFQAKEVLLTKQGDCLILTNFEGSYITPEFMNIVRKELVLVKHLIKKNAFIGTTFTQRLILKGFRLFIDSDDYIDFNTRQEAIDYLIRK